jgi:hypothetical protein
MPQKKVSWALSALMLRDEFRSFVGRCRYRLLRKNLKTLDTKGVPCIDVTLAHNLSALDHIATDFHMRRMKWLIFGTLANELVSPTSKFLMVGPRTENEILLLKALGYTNVVGLDLISYSPWIRLGDMHAMPFQDDSFDVVICGWTITYSKDPGLLAREIVRVTRSGGVFALGFQHVAKKNPGSAGDSRLLPREEAPEGRRVNSIADLKRLFEGLCHITPILQYDALLGERPAEETKSNAGLASSQVLFVATLTK